MDIGTKFAAIKAGLLDGALRIEDDRIDDSSPTNVPARSGSYFFEVESAISAPWVASKSGRVTNFVGAYSYMNSGGYLRENVLIGRYVSIGRRVTVAAGGHSMRALSTSPSVRGIAPRPYTQSEQERTHRTREMAPFTVIESDVWIGDGAIILPGVHLAVGSVIGANAVVVRDTLPYEIVGGVAAKTIGSRFDERTAAALLESEWWEYDRETLNRFPCSNVFEFLEGFTGAARPPRATFRTFLHK